MYQQPNKPQSEMTATPSKYPQGFFKEKPCRHCSALFKPQSPSHLYCKQECADYGVADAYYMRVYKIGVTDYLSMFEKQNGVCAICHTAGFNMKKKHEGQLVVDHCHDTGKVRGLLCHNCNRGLGLFQDSKEFLKRSIAYLEGATTIPQGSTLKQAEAPSP